MSEAPERIRVAQDAEGFWTCREAIPGSQEYVRADRIEAVERENAALRDDDAKMQLLHQQEDQLIAAERKVAELEADKARLSEALREARTSLENYGDRDGYADEDGHVPENDEGTLARETIKQIDAALAGSGSRWRVVPVEPSRDHLERLARLWGYTLEETADSYAAFLEALPAAPQQGGE